MNFGLGDPTPKVGAPSPKLLGALGGDPEVVHSGERTVAISVAVAEKIEFEENNLTPSSGETGSGRGPRWRMWGVVPDGYNP